MMRKTELTYHYLSALALLALLLVAGCAGGPLLTDETTVKARGQEIIAKAEVGLIEANRALRDEATAGVLTKAELTAAGEKLDSAGIILTKAQQARRNGLFAESLQEALKSEKLLDTVQQLLAERIKKQRKTP
jgi:hypothetical protein